MTQLLSTYGVWLVAAFIALESVGLPFPAEAALMAAGFLAAGVPGFPIHLLLTAGIAAAILGNAIGFWIGRKHGQDLLLRYGPRIGLTPQRIRIGQWLFQRYGGRFIFVARFLPFLRNMAAVLAGTSAMPAARFHLAGGAAAVLWVTGYGLGSYHLGVAFAELATPAAAVLGLAAVAIVLGGPALVVRYEQRLLARIDREASPET